MAKSLETIYKMRKSEQRGPLFIDIFVKIIFSDCKCQIDQSKGIVGYFWEKTGHEEGSHNYFDQ